MIRGSVQFVLKGDWVTLAGFTFENTGVSARLPGKPPPVNSVKIGGSGVNSLKFESSPSISKPCEVRRWFAVPFYVRGCLHFAHAFVCFFTRFTKLQIGDASHPERTRLRVPRTRNRCLRTKRP